MSDLSFKLLSWNNTLLYVYIFLFIYTPFVLPTTNIIHVLTLVAYFKLFTSFKNDINKIYIYRPFKAFFIIHFILIIFTIILGLSTENDFSNTYFLASTLFEVFPICVFISLTLRKKGASLVDSFNVMLLIGCVQLAFVVGSIISPAFRDLTLIYFPKDDFFDTVFTRLGDYRMFGLARSYTYAMPLYIGFCLIVAFLLGVYRSKTYFLLLPIYLIIIVANARIGLISIPIVLLVVFFLQLRSNFFKQILSLFLIIVAMLFVVSYIESRAASSFDYNMWTWLNDGFQEWISLSKGKKTGNMEALADTMWIFPEEESIFFGTGVNIFLEYKMNSDIGYVLNLYYGGIFFCVLLYVSYLSIFIGHNMKHNFGKGILISTVLYLFTANFKGAVFLPNELTHGVLLIIVFLSISNRRKNLIEERRNVL